MIRNIKIIGAIWLITAVSVMASPVRKTLHVDGFEREYLVHTPSHFFPGNANGILVCLHGFGRTMYDFFEKYDIKDIADSLNLIIAVPQALPEQDQLVNLKANVIGSLTNEQILLNSVWGCGLRIRAADLFFGIVLLNEVLNKGVDDVNFIDRLIDEVLADYSLPAENIFVLGTSMGGYMTYRYALEKGERLSGIISIAGSMGVDLDITVKADGTKIPVCDFHSITDEVVPYTGSHIQYLSTITLAKPKTDVINYWSKTNLTGSPVTEQIQYYPSTNEITVEKITYPDPDNEVIHYKINGAPHSYFFKEENGDCMDHVEEITRFIRSHITGNLTGNPAVTEPEITFYPNPVVDRIYFSAISGSVSIYDLAGRKLFTQPFTNGQADLSSLKPGIYIIHIHSANTIQIEKLLKR